MTLAESEVGFNEIEPSLPGLTPKVLAARLDTLWCRGLVDREVHPTSPPRTTYRLTPEGYAFLDRLETLEGAIERCSCDETCMAVADPC